MKNHILVMGPPGSGKGTQSKLLAAKLGLLHVSTGDLVRREGGRNDVRMARQVGGYAMDFCVSELIKQEIFSCPAQGVVIDGHPRTRSGAAQYFDSMPVISCIVVLMVAPDISTQRILHRLTDPVTGQSYSDFDAPTQKGLARRAEDKAEVIPLRLAKSEKDLPGAISFFEKKMPGKILAIDGSWPVNDVHLEILERISRISAVR